MTKALTKAEKQRRKDERRKKGNQQKPPSPTVKTVQQPKRPNLERNLCDECGYEVGQCDGTPKFAHDYDPNLKGAAADRVVECGGFLHIDQVPNDQGKTGEPAAGPGAAGTDQAQEKKGQESPPEADDAAHADDDQPPQDEEESEEEPEPEVVKADAIQRAPLDRFEKDDTDYGACPSCGVPLKRTAYSRYVDAIRCTNGRCSAYRNIVKTVPSGAK